VTNVTVLLCCLKRCRFSLPLLCFASIVQPAFAATCESLSGLRLPDTAITSAQTVAAGAFAPSGATFDPDGAATVYKGMPAFCRVTAEIKPDSDSNIKVEVWMPVSGWNGKYRGQGNGGFAGTINYQGMASAVTQGYATASTDTGHPGSPVDSGWALGHPEKIVDFGYRAIHEMTVKAKAIIQNFYGEAPKRSYFAACSNGGRQALMEAQRFPQDYDGLIAGAPANYWTHIFATFIWDVQALQSEPGSYIPEAKIPAISAAVLAACDANDGVKDGLLNDPRQCRFDPAVLVCKQAEDNSCLTEKQVTALTKIYSGPRDQRGKQIYPAFEPGGEQGPGGWDTWIFGPAPGKDLQTFFASGFFGNMVAGDAKLDVKTVNLAGALKQADEKQGHTFNAIDPNLKPFASRGGKLIIYHGWSDAALPPVGTIDYYNQVQHALGRKLAGKSARLYMAPGMQHCTGGPGADSFGQFGTASTAGDPEHDIYAALEQWVEKGIAPERIIAKKYVKEFEPGSGVKLSRPLCPYPQFARYKGSGDINDAASFECAAAK
jgi:feruloyl esterase